MTRLRLTGGAALGVAMTFLFTTPTLGQQPPQRGGQDPSMVTDSAGLDEAARQIFMAGRNLYDLGRFVEAAQQFEQAYELSRRPGLLYNVYVAYRDAGDRDKSAAALETYLRENPDAPDRVNLEARLASLRESIAEEQAARDQAAEEARAAEVARQEEEARRQADEERRQRAATRQEPSIVPWIVAAGGAALVVGGIVTGAITLADRGGLDADCPDGLCPSFVDLEEIEDRQSAVETLALVTDILLIGGGVIAAGGLVWALLQGGGSEDDEAPAPSVACGPTGCMASMRGRF